jgi:anti-anti-sigma regulatory factor
VVSRDGGTETIAVVGDLDIERAVRLGEAVRHAETGTADRIVVDLREASSLDHPALEMLWAMRIRLEEWPERLLLVPPVSEAVRRFIADAGRREMLFGARGA